MTASAFVNDVVVETTLGDRLKKCIQCGSCGGSCPNGAEMEYTPRALFALITADEREEVLSANTMWKCVSCYLCMTRCPQEIPITYVMYALKRMSIREGFAADADASALAHTFGRYVERYGRSFEFGIATSYLLLRRPRAALKMGGLGLKMFRTGRLSLKPTKIRKIEQLQAILAKARELGGQS